jgi:ribosome-binding factor A
MPREFSRRLRVNTQLQQVLSELIREELRDPRIAGVTLTEVDVSPDLRQAQVKVSSLADEQGLVLAVQGLNHAAGKLRHGLGKRMELRCLPTLRFVADTRLREADRITQMIVRARREDEGHAQPVAGDPPPRT